MTHACAVAVSNEHACAVEQSGAVACWGGNRDGQCGQDTDYTFDVRHLVVARSVPRIAGAVEVAVGAYGSCALQRGGVSCWGSVPRDHAALADAGAWDPTQPTPLPALADATALSASWSCGCAVQRGGAVRCFSMNANACAGLDASLPWERIAEASGVRRLALGSGGVCVETVSDLRCWRPKVVDAHGVVVSTPILGERIALPAGGIDDLAVGAAPCFRTGNVLRCWSVGDWRSTQVLGEPRALRIE